MPGLSKTMIFIIIILLAGIRLHYINWDKPTKTNFLTWDVFGYYLYLPAAFIYKDIKKMEWVPDILDKYKPTGNLYQLHKLPNGNQVGKYFLGLSVLYSPFFSHRTYHRRNQ